MKQARRVQKHFPTTTSQGSSDPLGNFALKSIGQSWLQIHNSQHLIDVLSLPSTLKMAHLYHYNNQETSTNPQSPKWTYFFACGSQLWVGQPDDNNMELICKEIQFHGSSMMTNGVIINDRMVNITTQLQNNQSYINLFPCDLQQDLTISQFQMGYTISPQTNLASDFPLLYSVYGMSDEQERSCLMAYDMEKQALCLEVQLPELRHQNYIRCLISPGCKQMICCYSSQYLAFIDKRTSTLINMKGLYNCEAVMNLQDRPSSLYFSQQNNVIQYDMRRYKADRTPVLTHPYCITGMGEIAQGLIKIEDQFGGGISLYNKS